MLAARGRAALSMSIAAALLLGGCATRPTDPEELEIYREVNDPFEPVNRAMFAVNQVLDGVVLRPVAIGYRKVVPNGVRGGVRNFIDNLQSPVILLNDLLQGEWTRARNTTGRFMTNTILGLGGVIDIATDAGIPKHSEDFGQTLAVWGVESGPYIVLPVLGPSTFRDGVGLGVDALADPVNHLGPDKYATEIMVARFTTDTVDWRSRNIEAIDELRRSSLDFYATVRSAYRQRRASEIRNGANGVDGLETMPPMIDFDIPDTTSPQDQDNAPPPAGQ